jgi:hypothetical protein
MARLTESYDGSPITGALVRFTVTNATGTHTSFATTNGAGIAQVVLPNGEHAVTAHFAGSSVYLSSTATQSPVYVYRPTTFVIWGGNAEGIVVGQRYNFWGSQWHKQVTGGDFRANASFKGYAFSVSGATWIGAPGSSVPPPPTIPEYIGVIVSTQIARDVPNTVGNVAGLVVLRVEDVAAYAPDPEHPGWGVMKSFIPPGVVLASGG